jgi:hypothetical protein
MGLDAVTSRSSTTARPEQREARRASMLSPSACAATHQTWGGGGQLEHGDAARARGGRQQHLRREEISRMPNILISPAA